MQTSELLQRLSVHFQHISIREKLGFTCSLTGTVINEDTVVLFYHTAINACLQLISHQYKQKWHTSEYGPEAPKWTYFKGMSLIFCCHSTLMQHSFSQQFKSTNTRYNYFITTALVWNTSYFSHFSHFHSSPWGLPAHKVSLKKKIYLRVTQPQFNSCCPAQAGEKCRQCTYKEISESTFSCPMYVLNYKNIICSRYYKRFSENTIISHWWSLSRPVRFIFHAQGWQTVLEVFSFLFSSFPVSSPQHFA